MKHLFRFGLLVAALCMAVRWWIDSISFGAGQEDALKGFINPVA